MDPELITMICTAGHVDHGKTSLVKLLTGCETDRLKVEKERGLTIEVGFAPCYLGDGLSCGIADVPGHEKFVRNMVAGVSGIDLAVLVIAADDGVMPQTAEHCQIMELLGVRRGLVALTKIDLVAPERVTEAKAEIEGFLAGTFLAGAPICPLSSKSGDGFFEFYDILVTAITQVRKSRSRGIFRMPIDKVFVNTGVGTVVTGIPVDGEIRSGDNVQVVPGGGEGRVRGIQRFTREAQEGSMGQCLAIQVPELSKAPPKRGDVLALPGWVSSQDTFHLEIRTVAGIDPPLRHTEEIKFHSGRSEVRGQVFLLGEEKLPGDRTGYAVITLDAPVASVPHDRFILRRPSPATTIAGGTILALPGRRMRNRELLGLLREQSSFFGDADPRTREGRDKRIEWFLLRQAPGGATTETISRTTMLHPEETRDGLAALVETGRILALEGDVHLHAQAFQSCLETVEARIHKAFEERSTLSLDLTELRRGLDWPAPVWSRVQADLAARRVAAFRDNKVVLKRAVEGLSGPDQELMDSIMALYEEKGWASPRPDELPELLSAPADQVKRLLEPLYHGGDLIRLTRNVVVSYGCFKRAQDEVVRIIREDGHLDSSKFKLVIGSTRKYALAMLDYLDTRHITIRVQHNNRKLTSEYEKRLL